MLPLPNSIRECRKVVLINPNRMQPPVGPIALDYLGHALEENNYEVDVIDLCFSTDLYSDIRDYFSQNQAIAVGFSIRNTDDVYLASQDFFLPVYRDTVNLLRMHTEAPIILGGAGFSVMPESTLDYFNLDFGIWGEGEIALPALLKHMATDQNYQNVPGLVYRTQKGFLINGPKYYDLDRITTPARNHIDNKRYFNEGGSAGIETKRGCPMNCIYCADPIGKGKKQRLRSPRSVVQEIKTLLKMGIDHFHICDSEFNIPEKHAREICAELIAHKLGEKIRWYTYAIPGGFSRELAALCHEAGCAGIDFGVDSGSDRMLRRLGRDFTVTDIEATVEVCRQEGIIFMYDLLLGGPGETRQSIEETIEFMKRISPDRVGISLGVRVHQNTKLADYINRQGTLNENPNLHGTIEGNDKFVAPIFYLSSLLGDDVPHYLSHLIGKDERFFFVSHEDVPQNYNYNKNTVLVNAIKEGYRGAFWDILRRIHEKK